MKIDQPGIYTISAADYHAIETPTPVLSASIARRLLGASPLHAWYDHHALNPAGVREQKEEFDLGTAAHAYLLEGETGFVIIDAPDWRTKAAKEQRDAARADGKVPLLAHRWADVQEMANAVNNHLDDHLPPVPFSEGKAEQTLVWREGDVWAKARLDWLHDDYRAVDDFKSGDNANPDVWTRGSLFSMGFDVQASWYLRGVKALTGEDAEFRFVCAETRAPYAVSVIGLGPDVLMLAEKKVRRALEMWRDCIRFDRWPGYPARTCYAELPAYLEAQWLERELRDEQFKDDGRPIGDLLAGERA